MLIKERNEKFYSNSYLVLGFTVESSIKKRRGKVDSELFI